MFWNQQTKTTFFNRLSANAGERVRKMNPKNPTHTHTHTMTISSNSNRLFWFYHFRNAVMCTYSPIVIKRERVYSKMNLHDLTLEIERIRIFQISAQMEREPYKHTFRWKIKSTINGARVPSYWLLQLKLQQTNE